ncbi:hypothetical protein M407DRAFT_18958 [Tulasnella calospora MUT 4182]|uniref:Ubiquitin-like domain-containing protein n=1 Tax=Tulasnella calospora MUT 4182 TaxID=1051891 RepID=A0A0C3MEF7_9AGAM|nr:hypothetical protein M407DRAFT_18958 [Tulasnella calospora MUT 4182]
MDFQAAVDLAKATFPSLKPVEIGPEAWDIASVGVDTFEFGIMEDGSQPSFDLLEASQPPASVVVPTAPAAAGPPKVEAPKGPPPNPPASTLIIKQTSGQITTLTDVRLSDVNGDLKQKIWSIEGIPPNNQTLIFSGKVLDNNRSLSSYGIQDLSSGYLVLMRRR